MTQLTHDFEPPARRSLARLSIGAILFLSLFAVVLRTALIMRGLRPANHAPAAQSITPITSLTASRPSELGGSTGGSLYASADRIDIYARSAGSATLNLVEYQPDDAKWVKHGADCAVATDLVLCRFVGKRVPRYWHVYKSAGTVAYVGIETALPSAGGVEPVSASSLVGTMAVANGGTGANTLSVGLLRGNGTSPVTGGNTVALATEVTGTLPKANGGLGQDISGGLTGGKVAFVDGSGALVIDNLPAAALPTGIDALNIGAGLVSNTRFGYLSTLTSNVQTQLDSKLTASTLGSKIELTFGFGVISNAHTLFPTTPVATASDSETGVWKVRSPSGSTWKVRLVVDAAVAGGETLTAVARFATTVNGSVSGWADAGTAVTRVNSDGTTEGVNTAFAPGDGYLTLKLSYTSAAALGAVVHAELERTN